MLCATLTTAALIAIAPWGGSSEFLARAAVALTPPGGTVLYERWEHVFAPEPGNRPQGATLSPEQLWIDSDRPHRYRAVLEPDDSLAPSAGFADIYGVNVAYVGGDRNQITDLARELKGQPLELGGSLEATTGKARKGRVLPTLTFLPPDELLSLRLSVALGASLPGPHDQVIERGADPVSSLRAALAEGRAHEAGSTELDGRTVRRIDLDLPANRPPDAPPRPANATVSHAEAYAYVEPETLRPVEIVFGLDTYRFLAYEYLPATSANLALADIRAQHPGASISKAGAQPSPPAARVGT